MRARSLLAASIVCASLAACAQGVSRTESRAAPHTEPTATSESSATNEPTETNEAPAPVAPEPSPPLPSPDPIATLLALEGSVSTSIGGPNDGRLEGAVALPESGPGFRSNPRRPNAEAFYGTVELVQALVRAAAVVYEALPGSELLVNDIGFERGGAITHHGSHRAGRDADVLFYLVDRHGDPIESVGAFLDPRGRGYDFRDLAVRRDDVLVRIDLPRTWRFVQALLEGPFADQVQRIFVAEHLRTLLLAQAERAHAPRAIRDRFADITCQPGYPHDDHLHVRFHCTPEDMAAGCQDTPPVYPWRRNALRELGLTPALETRHRSRQPSRRVSAGEARESAGPMDSRVEEWLTMREAWMRAPHPGRTYCR